MSSDKPVPDPDVFVTAANGNTAGSYHTDGRYNRGGWSTYPSADELAISTTSRPSEANQEDIRK